MNGFINAGMTPRPKKKLSHSMPVREIEIGQRVRMVRQNLRYSQTKFSEIISINRPRLAHYESGRTPLIFSVGWTICRRFKTNPRWLVTGKGPEKSDFLLSSHYNKIKKVALPKMAFSEAYNKHIEPMLKEFLPKTVFQAKGEDVIEDSIPEKFEAVEKFRQYLLTRIIFIKYDHLSDYIKELRISSNKLLNKYEKEGKSVPMKKVERL